VPGVADSDCLGLMQASSIFFGGSKLREGCVNPEQMNPAALVYFIDRKFGGSRVA